MLVVQVSRTTRITLLTGPDVPAVRFNICSYGSSLAPPFIPQNVLAEKPDGSLTPPPPSGGLDLCFHLSPVSHRQLRNDESASLRT